MQRQPERVISKGPKQTQYCINTSESNTGLMQLVFTFIYIQGILPGYSLTFKRNINCKSMLIGGFLGNVQVFKRKSYIFCG